MNNLIDLSEEELELVVNNTAEKMNLSTAIVEKDLWVCLLLKYLFSDFKFKNSIIFKGGTSLSKVYHLIDRFSEDIDLALDWQLLGFDEEEPYLNRSNTQQLKFNKLLNDNTAKFIEKEFLPLLKSEFGKLLGNRKFDFYIDQNDPQTICFAYPRKHNDTSILQIVRLEIGCLAEPIPYHKRTITTYIEDTYPTIFSENINVVVVDSLRTFLKRLLFFIEKLIE